eukprot:UN00801
MFLVIIAALFWVSNGQMNINGSWSDCSKPDDKGAITNIIFPAMGAGYNFTIIGVGSTSEAIVDPSFDMHIKFGIFVNDNIKGDGCKDLKFDFPLNDAILYYNALPCPIAAGPVNVSFVLWFSDKCPDGEVVNTFTIYDEAKEKGNEVVCTKVQLAITG